MQGLGKSMADAITGAIAVAFILGVAVCGLAVTIVWWIGNHL